MTDISDKKLIAVVADRVSVPKERIPSHASTNSPPQDRTLVVTMDSASDKLNDYSPLMRVPAELRVRIYQLLLVPPLAVIVDCPHSCSCFGPSVALASTSKPSPSQMRAFGAFGGKRSCDRRGRDVHASILRTSRQIYREATAVLYENIEVTKSSSINMWPPCLSTFAHHIRYLCLEDPTPDIHRLPGWLRRIRDDLPELPNLQVVRLHQDMDFGQFPLIERPSEDNLDVLTGFGPGVEFVVDVHIIAAWSRTDYGWSTEIVSRKGVPEAELKELEAIAMKLRQQLVDLMRKAFEKAGKVLKIREG